MINNFLNKSSTPVGTGPIKMGPTEIVIGNLRDTFACAAMQALIAVGEVSLTKVVQDAYVMADAMMAEREKK